MTEKDLDDLLYVFGCEKTSVSGFGALFELCEERVCYRKTVTSDKKLQWLFLPVLVTFSTQSCCLSRAFKKLSFQKPNSS